MRVYLAHPVSDYGTPRQAKMLALLAGAGHTVENPDAPSHQEGYRQHGMEYFTNLVETCDGLAFSRFADGTIGAGVAKEIERALTRRMPIWDVTGGNTMFSTGEWMPAPVLSVEDTRAMLKALMEPEDECPDCGKVDCEINH